MEINKCLFYWFHFEHRNHCRAHNKTWFLAYAPQSTAEHVIQGALFNLLSAVSLTFLPALWFQLSCDWIYHLWVLSFLKLNSTLPQDLNQKLLEGESLLQLCYNLVLQHQVLPSPGSLSRAVFVVDHEKRNGAATHRQSDQTLMTTLILMPEITTCYREGREVEIQLFVKHSTNKCNSKAQFR